MELGSAGPKALAKELGISPATAFRDLNLLEQKGLIHSLGDGKRALREEGSPPPRQHPLTVLRLSRGSAAASPGTGRAASIDDQLTLIWNEAREQLRTQMNERTFRLWFDRTLPVDLSDGTFVLGVPNDFALDWIEKRFADKVGDALTQVLGDTVRLEPRRRRARGGARRGAADAGGGGAAEPARPAPPKRSTRPRARPRPGGRRPARALADLNPRYVFDRFVTGPHNEYADRRRAQRRRVAGRRLQPGVHLRRHRPRQDPPHPGDRPRRAPEAPVAAGEVRDRRALHRRLHQRGHRQGPHRGLQAGLPRRTTSCSSTTSSSSPRSSRRRSSSSTRSTRSTRRDGRSSSPRTGRRASSRSSKSACARASARASSSTSAGPTSRPASPSCASR